MQYLGVIISVATTLHLYRLSLQKSALPNRDLEAQIEEAEHMLTEIDIESMPFFSIGFERGEKKGLVKGIEKGREEGREEGMERGEARVVRRLLNRHSVTEVSALLDLPVDEVERIAVRGDGDAPARGRH